MMRLIFLGPPGAGKGTQARIASERFGIPHISTGDIFRKNMKNNTDLGKKAAEYSNKGLLVPDEVTNAMVKDRLANDDCRAGYILDGYPRTIVQAEFLATIQKIDMVLNFELNDQEVIRRISGRRTCQGCGEAFHMEFKRPAKPGVCDKCSGKLLQRDDEKPDVVQKRLQVYYSQTHPLIDYYKKKGILKEVDAKPSVNEISEKMLGIIEKKI